MTDHVHEWFATTRKGYLVDSYFLSCGCGAVAKAEYVSAILNEHGKLEAENERLRELASAYMIASEGADYPILLPEYDALRDALKEGE